MPVAGRNGRCWLRERCRSNLLLSKLSKKEISRANDATYFI
jgi:hypothetical protein